MIQIKPANLDAPRLIALPDAHASRAPTKTAAGSEHAIDHGGLQSEEISL